MRLLQLAVARLRQIPALIRSGLRWLQSELPLTAQNASAMRAAAAARWRSVLKFAAVLIAFTIFLGAQCGVAVLISEWWWYPIALGALLIGGLAVLFKSPFAACVGWLAFSPWAGYLIHANVGGAFVLTFDRVLLPALAIVLVLRLLRHRARIRRPRVAEWLLLGYMVYIALCEVFIKPMGFKDYLGLAWESLVSVGAAYFIVKGSIGNLRQIELFLKAIAVVGLVWAVTGIWEHYTGSMWLGALFGYRMQLTYGDVAKGRAQGPADHIYAYGAVLILSTFVSYLLAGRARNVLERAFYYTVSALSMLALFFSYTRAAYIGLLVCWLVTIAYARGRRIRYLAFAGAIVFVMTLVGPVVWEHRDFRDRMLNVMSAQSRMPMNRTAVNMAMHNLYFGVGGGRLQQYISQYMTEMGYRVSPRRGERGLVYSYPHNDFLIVLVERGLVGFIFFYGAVFFVMRRMVKLCRHRLGSGPARSELGAVMLGFAVSCLFMSAFSEVLSHPYPYLYFLLFATLAMFTRYAELVEVAEGEPLATMEEAEGPDLPMAGRPLGGLGGPVAVGRWS